MNHNNFRKSNLQLIVPLLAFLFFCMIAYFVATNDTLTFDTIVSNAVYHLRHPVPTWILTLITYLANWQTITGICFILLLYPRSRLGLGLPLSSAAILSTILYKLVKTLFTRQRPDLSLHLITQGGYSFPSGHAMTSLVFYGLVIWFCRIYIKNAFWKNVLTILLVLLIFLISFSRIYLGVHFPTDILGGWMLGISLLFLFLYLYKLFFFKKGTGSHPLQDMGGYH